MKRNMFDYIKLSLISWLKNIRRISNSIDVKFQKLIKPMKERQVSFIAKNLGEIYKDGIPIDKALLLVQESVSDKKYKASLGKIFREIRSGKSLSEGFKQNNDLYPKLFTTFISIGENTGRLYDSLIYVGRHYERIKVIKENIKRASVYPCFILCSIVLAVVIFIGHIIPGFYGIYQSMGIDPSNLYKSVYEFQKSFKESYISGFSYIFCWSAIVLIIIRMAINNDKLNYMLKLKIVKEIFEYMIILNLAIITNSGMSILEGINCCIESTSFEYMNKKMIDIRNCIIRGNTLSEALEESRTISNYSIAVVKIKEETGKISEAFENLSEKLENDIQKRVDRCLKSLGPVLVVVMGIIVCIFILFFMLPLFTQLQKGIG